jgi:hypothetical protein
VFVFGAFVTAAPGRALGCPALGFPVSTFSAGKYPALRPPPRLSSRIWALLFVFVLCLSLSPLSCLVQRAGDFPHLHLPAPLPARPTCPHRPSWCCMLPSSQKGATGSTRRELPRICSPPLLRQDNPKKDHMLRGNGGKKKSEARGAK